MLYVGASMVPSQIVVFVVMHDSNSEVSFARQSARRELSGLISLRESHLASVD